MKAEVGYIVFIIEFFINVASVNFKFDSVVPVDFCREVVVIFVIVMNVHNVNVSGRRVREAGNEYVREGVFSFWVLYASGSGCDIENSCFDKFRLEGSIFLPSVCSEVSYGARVTNEVQVGSVNSCCDSFNPVWV